MKIKIDYRRPGGDVVPLVVTADTATTVAEVARELIETDPHPASAHDLGDALTLRVQLPNGGRELVLDADCAIGEAELASGATVSVVNAGGFREQANTPAAAVLTVIDGPDRGRSYPLRSGASVIGRDPAVDVVLSDGLVSKRHARINVGGVVELVDLNSANGILADGLRVPRIVLTEGQSALIGETTVTATVTRPVSSGATRALGGSEKFHRSPFVQERFAERKHPRPQVPAKPTPPVFSWIMLIAPIAMGITMFFITGRAMSLLFVAMAPMMMGANFMNSRMKNRRSERTDAGKFETQIAQLEALLHQESIEEGNVRRAEAPSTAEIYSDALTRGPLLWTRRPEHWSFLSVRLGVAALPSRATIAPPPDVDDGIPALSQRLRDLEERYALVPDVPVIESLPLVGALGVVGAQHGMDVLRAILIQLTGLHSPAELAVVALTSPQERAELDWLRWLPHSTSGLAPIDGIHLADSQPTIAAVMSNLEGLAAERLGRRAEEQAPLHGPLDEVLMATAVGGRLGGTQQEPVVSPPVVVVAVTEHALVDRARLVQLAENAARTGVIPVWLASQQSDLPAVCRTFIDVTRGISAGEVGFVRHGRVISNVKTEGVPRDHAEVFARALAPLVDSGAVVADSSDLPHEVSLLTLLGDDIVRTSDAVIERWRQNASLHDRAQLPQPRARAGTLRAMVGQMGVDAMTLDLRTQGPHALVGGTTGAGKSEFLQAWVLGMAAEYSPDRVTFLFVDYKGGAAFADCVRLPHCVGLVTDLSPHLVRRALTSLRAELRYREHFLNEKKAKDLLELERRGDHDAPPALVLVVDEFAALSKEVPEFVEGVVDIAQRGRSLGIHLILATQRPAGVIKDNIRANTNLRIALRMADESDSSDVIGLPIAAHFDPTLPGRGIAKTGPGRLTPFQSAYAGGRTGSTPVRKSVIQVQELAFGSEPAWERPQAPQAEVVELGPTDQLRLVDSLVAGAERAQIPLPRKPWLAELSNAYDLARLNQRTDRELVLGVADLPEEQAQRTMRFMPDVDGNLAVYGTSGSGKTVLLRTLAIGAGITPRGGPVHVYALDFAAGGLRMLEALPHVGAVISGEDHDRVVRLLRTLQALVAERAEAFPAVDAGNLDDYRRAAGKPHEPRILLLVDNLPAFREAYEVVGPRVVWYAALQQLMSEGRQFGIHVVFTADRPGSVPGSITASVPRRVVLRLAEENAYRMLGVVPDVLDGAPPGRAIVDGFETQIAVMGGLRNVADQSRAIGQFARALARQGVGTAPGVRVLPTAFAVAELPAEINGMPVLGLGDDTLGPVGFDATGGFLIGGGPGSGRTNAVLVVSQAIRRWRPEIVMIYFGARRSNLPQMFAWDMVATTPEDIGAAAKQLSQALKSGERKRQMAIIVEGVADLVNTPADAPLVELLKYLRRTEHLFVGEAETASWGSIFPLYGEFKNARQGFLLQPEWNEGDAILRTPFPRSQRSDFPAGRGMLARGGRAVKVQLPLHGGESSPLSGAGGDQ